MGGRLSSAVQDKEWFYNPKGWLLKPDFKRPAQQRRVTVDNSILRNFSVKSLFSKGYQRRWFVLNTETSVLEYFESDSVGRAKLKPLGIIDLSAVTDVIPSTVFDAPPFSIDLISPGKVYTLAADSADVISNWTTVLCREIEKLRCQREIRANRTLKTLDTKQHNRYARPDCQPAELVKSIMSCYSPLQFTSSVLRPFYSKIVSLLLNPMERLDPLNDQTLLEFPVLPVFEVCFVGSILLWFYGVVAGIFIYIRHETVAYRR